MKLLSAVLLSGRVRNQSIVFSEGIDSIKFSINN